MMLRRKVNSNPSFVTPTPSPKMMQDNKLLVKPQSFVSRAAQLLEEVVQTIDSVQCSSSGSYIVRQLEEEFRMESQDHSNKLR
jgi:hypothetical protein